MGNITTYTKKPFDPMAPDADSLDIRDIAHALSLLCRANGHFPHFYSVAQHSLNCLAEAKARGCGERVQLACLLHDAAEAYMADMPRPVKEQLPLYREKEADLLDMILARWLDAPLSGAEYAQVFEIDDAMLYHEFLSLMGQEILTPRELISTPSFDIAPFETAESKMLLEFSALVRCEGSLFVGVDWCRGKWLAAELRGGVLVTRLHDDIAALCRCYESAEAVLIDTPIGLADSAENEHLRPDRQARTYLRSSARKSSVFNAPYRGAVYADSPDEQRAKSRTLGKGISAQTVAIIPMIRQVDTFLRETPQWQNRLLESHPELAFQALNHGNGLVSSKHTPEGISERTAIIREYIPDFEPAQSHAEDRLDAVCLAVTAKLGSESGFRTIPESPVCDSTGLKMQIVLCR